VPYLSACVVVIREEALYLYLCKQTDRQTDRYTDRQRQRKTFTEKDLCRLLGRQPEDDQSEKGQKDARQNEDVVVEDGDALELDAKHEVPVRILAAPVVHELRLGRMFQQRPLVALYVVVSVHLNNHKTETVKR